MPFPYFIISWGRETSIYLFDGGQKKTIHIFTWQLSDSVSFERMPSEFKFKLNATAFNLSRIFLYLLLCYCFFLIKPWQRKGSPVVENSATLLTTKINIFFGCFCACDWSLAIKPMFLIIIKPLLFHLHLLSLSRFPSP